MDKIIIGMDLGGTHMRIGAVSSGNILNDPQVYKTAVLKSSDDPAKQLCHIIEEYIKSKNVKLEDIEAVSIGVPSSVANDKSTVICTTNICDENGNALFENVDLGTVIKDYFGLPAYINNDVNNILLYDIEKNHLEKEHITAGIYIGTGVGAAIIIDGKQLDGNDGAALDLGHMPYFGGTDVCSCGKTGCCECYASGWKLQEIRKKYYPDTCIDDLFTKHKDDVVMRNFIRSCAYVYAIVATIFNPAAIIVGGGVMEMKDFPRAYFEAAVNEMTGKDVMKKGFKYVYSQKYVGKGIIGAAILARCQKKSDSLQAG